MAVNYVWRARWRYTDATGKPLDQWPEQTADVIATLVPPPAGGGGDGTARPDPASLKTGISNNFQTPAGASIALLVVSSAQCAAVYS